MFSKWFAVFSIFLILSGCESDHVVFDENVIRQDSLINHEAFIEQSKKRSDEAIKYGPKIADNKDNKAVKERFRKKIHTEYAPDYVDLRNDGNWKLFPIDINIENMEMRIFAEMLSRITGANIIVSDEVRGTVSAKLKNVPWQNVLDTVLQMKALAKHVDSKAGIIRIHDQGTVVQLEDFKRQRQENLHRARQLEMASEPRHTEIYKLFYTDPDTIKSTLEGVFNISDTGAGDGFLQVAPELTIDNRLNLLIVEARDEDMKVISKLIKQLDSRTKQVFIEAFIVEVTDGFQDAFGARLGLDFSRTGAEIGGTDFNSRLTGLAGTAASSVAAGDSAATISNLPVTSPFGGIGYLTGVGSAADLKIELTAMETDGLSRVVSNPRVFTLDNQEAIIFQGDEVPFETVSDQGTQIEFKEAGLKLAVKPTVIGDGNLLMNIKVNKDTADTSVSNPPISKSEIQTSLVSQDGSIVVIGGIYDEEKSTSKDRVPGAADVPLLGKLFKRETQQDDRSELMIFIAPRII